MAIQSKRNFKTVLGAADLELEARKGQSFLIKNIMIFSESAVYAVIKIEKTTVGLFRVKSVLGNHLQIPHGRAYHSHDLTMGTTAHGSWVTSFLPINAGGEDVTTVALSGATSAQDISRLLQNAQGSSVGSETLLQYLEKKGLFAGFPVESGQTFLIDLVVGTTSVKIVEYDIYDEGDITADMENGSKSDIVTYINYGDYGDNLQAEVDPVLAQTNNPPEFTDFPFGDVVPAGRKIEVIGILASDVSPKANVTGTCTQTKYLKLMRGTKFLFDEDREGLLYYSPFPDSLGNEDMIAEGYAVGGNYTEIDRREPLMFEPALEFSEGEKLTVMWNLEIGGNGAVISQALHEIAFILKISPEA